MQKKEEFEKLAKTHRISAEKIAKLLLIYSTIDEYRKLREEGSSREFEFEKKHIDIQLIDNPGFERLIKDIFKRHRCKCTCI